MKNILKKLALLCIPVVVWFVFFAAFEPNNYFGLKASATSSQPWPGGGPTSRSRAPT